MTSAEPLILLIEDELPVHKFLGASLPAHGFRLLGAETGKDGLARAADYNPDVVLLDLGLPDMDGLEVTRRLREWSSVPIVVLSARGQEKDKIAALDAGADDYLTKPFSGRELLARVRAVLRRTPAASEPAVVRIGDIEIDRSARVVRRAGTEVRLTAKEYALFQLLVQHRGRVVTHRQILREIWGPAAEERTDYLRVHMTHLRQKLEADPHQPRHLKTDAGIGYRLVDI